MIKSSVLRPFRLSWKSAFRDPIQPSDFSVHTWLAFGATLQLLIYQLVSVIPFLPSYLTFLPPILYLTCRLGLALYDCTRICTGVFKSVRVGRWTAGLAKSENETPVNDGVIMFLLGSRINHPMGKLAPGYAELDTIFEGMFIEAEMNRSKWNYLGVSPTLYDSSDKEGKTSFWLSYWKDLEGLQAFAVSAAHRLGQDGYNQKKFPYFGIMHETFHAPKGYWECIYDNMPPVALGTTKSVIGKGPEGLEFHHSLQKNRHKSTMYSRMGREIVANDDE